MISIGQENNYLSGQPRVRLKRKAKKVIEENGGYTVRVPLCTDVSSSRVHGLGCDL